MKEISQSWIYNGVTVRSIWHTTSQLPDEKISQVYCVAFTDDGKILIITSAKNEFWNLPGGKPEAKENYFETAIREVEEEASVDIYDVKLLGYAEVFTPENNNGVKPGRVIQLRCFARIKKINKLHPDTDGGIIRKRRFVSHKNFTKYIRWGDVGEKIYYLALEKFKEK